MDRFFDYFMGIATGMCLLGWGINPQLSTALGLIGAVIAISMAMFSLGRAVQEKREKASE